MVGANGVAGHGQAMEAVFPEAMKTLTDADPEMAAIIEDEKRRQWCARRRIGGGRAAGRQQALVPACVTQLTYLLFKSQAAH